MIRVVLDNQTNRTLGIPDRMHGCPHVPRRFDVTGDAGGRAMKTPRDVCRHSVDHRPCAELMGIAVPQCLLCDPVVPDLVLAPNEQAALLWDPLLFALTQLPGECGEHSSELCSVPMRAPPGAYEFSARAADCFVSVDGKAEASCTGNYDLVATASWDGTCPDVTLVFTEDG